MLAILMTVMMPTTDIDTTKELITEIVIEASTDRVWEVLTDFNNYESWNPFIVKSEGELVLNNKITNHMLNGGKVRVFKPIITLVEEGKHFEWLGSMPFGLFKGNHYFILEALGENRCKLIHGERFSGLLRKSIMKSIGEETLQGFNDMNQALKERAEQ